MYVNGCRVGLDPPLHTVGQAPPYRFCGRSWSAQALQPSPKPAPFRPLPRRAKPAAGEGWGGGSDICRYTKSGLKYRPFTYTNPAILYVNCRQCCLGGGASPTLQVLRTDLVGAGAATAPTKTIYNGLLNRQRGRRK